MIQGGASLNRENCGPHVAIVLSLHNGEAWLNAQLDSFLAQTHVNWTLYWRDDGSSDSSRAIMLSFAAHRGQGRCIEIESSAEGLGVRLSYAFLIDRIPPHSFLSFADQDDIWQPEKLAWGLETLASTLPEQPALYCARQYLVDTELNIIGRSPQLKRLPCFASALIQNLATGHTVLLNSQAVRLLRDFPPPVGVLHDWWAYIVVMGAGGAFHFDARCVSRYRQHTRNAVGAHGTRARRAIGAIRRGRRSFIENIHNAVAQLLSRPSTLKPDAILLVQEIHDARNRRDRLALLWHHPELHRQTAAETVLFRIWYLMTSIHRKTDDKPSQVRSIRVRCEPTGNDGRSGFS